MPGPPSEIPSRRWPLRGQPHPVLLADPPIAAISIEECGEPLVDLRNVPELRLDVRRRDPDETFGLLRAGVVARLLQAQAACPPGVQLLVVEGYRTPERQRREFEDYRRRLHERWPEWDAVRAYREASAYISPPEVAPHCTGGAVDLTLCGGDGVELDMGTPVNASPHDCDNACYTGASTVGAEAIANRRLLVEVLTGAGLVNYPTEWWHWSYGERYWTFSTGAAAAVYGPVTRP
jgi:D-alanyl-D-alanine dipeptidase